MTDTYVSFPVFRALPEAAQLGSIGLEEGAREWEAIFAKAADRVTVRGTYATAGFRPDADLMFWWIAPTVDDLQELAVSLRPTMLGRAVEQTWAFLGLHQPAEFNRDHVPAFLKGDPPGRYISVYPFVRTPDWYLLPPEERGRLLREHGEVGRKFPAVRANTTASFGLTDWEWILAFESDELPRIVECIRALRAAEARRYTKSETPFVAGIRKELAEAVRDLSR